MKPFLALLMASLVALAPAASFAASSGPLAKFIGNWVGDGMVRPRGFDLQRVIRCKVTGRQDQANQISFAGRCATPEGAGRFQVLIASDKTGKRLAATARFATSRQQIDFSGKAQAQTIILRQTAPITRGGRKLVSTMRFTFANDGRLTMTNRVSDLQNGAQALSLIVRFKRQP